MITRRVRKGYTMHLPKAVIITGPAEISVASLDVLKGQEHKLEPVVITQPIAVPEPIASPEPVVAAMEEPVAQRPVKRRRGQRGRSRIRKDD